MGTDRCAYLSKLKNVDPIPKVWFTLAALLICVFADSVVVGLFTLAALSVLNLVLGGQKAGDLLHFLKVPLAFLLMGCLTIILRPIGEAPALPDGLHDLQGSQNTVTGCRMFRENDMSGLFTTDTMPILNHIFINIFIPNSGLFISDALFI